MNEIERALAQIHDPALRERFAAILAMSDSEFPTLEEAQQWEREVAQARAPKADDVPSSPDARLAQDLRALKQCGGGGREACAIIANHVRHAFHAPEAVYHLDAVARVARTHGLAAAAEAAQSLLRTSEDERARLSNPWGLLEHRARALVARN